MKRAPVKASKKIKKAEPPPSLGMMTDEEVAKKADAMRRAIYDAADPLDTVHVVTTLKGKAKNGDLKATEMYLRLYGIGNYAPPAERDERPANMVQVNVGDNNRDQVTVNTIDGVGQKVAILILIDGPQPPRVISSRCAVPPEAVESLLDTDLFEMTPKGKLQLTEVGETVAKEAARKTLTQ